MISGNEEVSFIREKQDDTPMVQLNIKMIASLCLYGGC